MLQVTVCKPPWLSGCAGSCYWGWGLSAATLVTSRRWFSWFHFFLLSEQTTLTHGLCHRESLNIHSVFCYYGGSILFYFFPSWTHTHTVMNLSAVVKRDIILLGYEYLLKQFWTDSEFWSVRYANPATSRVPKKPPITQPMSMKKLVPLSTCESQFRVLNWSSNAFCIYNWQQLHVKAVVENSVFGILLSLPWTCRKAEGASLLFDHWHVTLVSLSEKDVPLRVHVAINSPFFKLQLP